MPFVITGKDVARCAQRTRDIISCGMLPKEVAYAQLQYMFETPAFLKMHDWLIVTGPIMKYVLQDCFQPAQRKPLFAYLDVLSRLWCKSTSDSHAETLLADVKVALADMEIHFPAWELDLNRHMVRHIAEAILRNGPSWVLTTFASERFWKRCVILYWSLIVLMHCSYYEHVHHPLPSTFTDRKYCATVAGSLIG